MKKLTVQEIYDIYVKEIKQFLRVHKDGDPEELINQAEKSAIANFLALQLLDEIEYDMADYIEATGIFFYNERDKYIEQIKREQAKRRKK
ncbi:MAG: hypothetical protein D6767_03180 [Candidatus Hydrogenedentota bacterium]|nr:MAG: hypothetical protein D6767_03180 [Candidatus Hydrogenedentota bacterium]